MAHTAECYASIYSIIPKDAHMYSMHLMYDHTHHTDGMSHGNTCETGSIVRTRWPKQLLAELVAPAILNNWTDILVTGEIVRDSAVPLKASIRGRCKSSFQFIALLRFCQWLTKENPLEFSRSTFSNYVATLMQEAGKAKEKADLCVDEIQVRALEETTSQLDVNSGCLSTTPSDYTHQGCQNQKKTWMMGFHRCDHHHSTWCSLACRRQTRLQTWAMNSEKLHPRSKSMQNKANNLTC